MDKAYQKDLLIQTKIFKGDFKVVLTLNSERLIITTRFFHIQVHTTIVGMGKKGNIHHTAHTNMLVHRPRNRGGQKQKCHYRGSYLMEKLFHPTTKLQNINIYCFA